MKRRRNILTHVLPVLTAAAAMSALFPGCGGGGGKTVRPTLEPVEVGEYVEVPGAYTTEIDVPELFTTEEAGKTRDVANLLNTRDAIPDTWVATDDLGRAATVSSKSPTDRKLGIFYFLWHDTGTHGGDGKIYDHSKAFYEGGTDALISVMKSGPLGFAHYWAEPYFGYYSSNDEWVIRKHTAQLTAAGIDFIFIDATNGLTYQSTYEKILKTWTKMRAEGNPTPQIAFHCGINDEAGPKSFKALWSNLYSRGKYSEFWFRYDGKPLIFLSKDYYDSLPQEQRDFFTVRHSWADTKSSWYTKNGGINCWPWADMYPQGEGKGPDGKLEQMIVMSGFWANGSFGTNGGRSYSYKNGGQPAGGNFGFDLTDSGLSGQGIAFQEQYEYAIGKDPGLIMLVGWNEWWAGRWEAGAAIGQTIANTYKVTDDKNWTRHYFVDTFNPEFSRDIEPVKGIYNDNYYYQMVLNNRTYKGTRALLPAFGQRNIDIDGPLGQWHAVGPEFRDTAGDITHRKAYSYVGRIRYENNSGRNDIVTAKVSVSNGKVYFMAECTDDITPPEGTNWMNLFIDADCDHSTGWYGYDYVINRGRDGNSAAVAEFVDGTWEQREIGKAELRVSGNTIQLSVDAALIKVGDTFDFKWADNSVDSGDVMQFIDQGDAAPNDRFNFRYTRASAGLALPDCLTADMTVLKAGSYFAFSGGGFVRLDSSTTKAVFLGDGSHYYVPRAFAAEHIGLDVSGAAVLNHYGVEYIDVYPLLASAGKTVTVYENTVVIAERELTESELLTLERALY